VLTRIFGAENLELAEDVVQDTLIKALEQWKISGVPSNPQAWLFSVARNKALDVIRRKKIHNKYAEDIAPLLKSEYSLEPTVRELFSENAIKDDVLRMMFSCCHPSLPAESQVALILKTLCGFSIGEIAKGFITNEETIHKRLYRAKQQFRDGSVRFEIPSTSQIIDRIDNVLAALYLLFNEGYHSASNEKVIRKDLITEATRLCFLLTENEKTNFSSVKALLALMLFHSSRLDARLDKDDHILLLEDQDRSLWDRELINAGTVYFERAMDDDGMSWYHLQAAIAFQHVTADSFQKTDWNTILRLYDLLCQRYPSPVAYLNRAIAISYAHDIAEAIHAIHTIPEIDRLKSYYLLPATLGELHFRNSDFNAAKKYFQEAISLTHSPAEQKLLATKIARCNGEE